MKDAVATLHSGHTGFSRLRTLGPFFNASAGGATSVAVGLVPVVTGLVRFNFTIAAHRVDRIARLNDAGGTAAIEVDQIAVITPFAGINVAIATLRAGGRDLVFRH